MKKKLIITVIVCCMTSIAPMISSCSLDDDGMSFPDGQGATETIDSIGFKPGTHAEFKYYYDQNGRVAKYRIGTPWSNSSVGSDTVCFDYRSDRIMMDMVAARRLNNSPVYKVHCRGTFYVKGGKVVCFVTFDPDTNYKDSVLCQYDGGRLAKSVTYTRYGDIDSDIYPYSLKYTKQFHWENGNLTGMKMTNHESTVWETTITYGSHPLTALLPDLVINDINDRGNTYLVVLANMGYFGPLPANEITSIQTVRTYSYFQQIKNIQIAYNYDAEGLPTTYNSHFQYWYNELAHPDADNNMIEETKLLAQEMNMQYFVKWNAQ